MAGKSADADGAGRGLDPLEGRRGPAGRVSRERGGAAGLPETLGGWGGHACWGGGGRRQGTEPAGEGPRAFVLPWISEWYLSVWKPGSVSKGSGADGLKCGSEAAVFALAHTGRCVSPGGRGGLCACGGCGHLVKLRSVSGGGLCTLFC